MKRGVEASTTIRVPLARARKVLVEDPGCAFCDRCSAAEMRARSFRTELAVDLGLGTSVHQEVAVEVGRPPSTKGPAGDGVTLAVRWRPTGRDRLFPSFDGELEAVGDGLGTRLRLRGDYVVPLGPVGRFGEGVAGRRLAHASLVALLEAMGRRIHAEVARRTAPLPPAVPGRSPHPVPGGELPTDCYLG